MNFKTLTSSLFIAISVSVNAQTQTFKVSGTVKDTKGDGVELATVILNNDLVTSTSTGGRFVLGNVPKVHTHTRLLSWGSKPSLVQSL